VEDLAKPGKKAEKQKNKNCRRQRMQM